MKKSYLKTAFFIAQRYLFSKKKHNIINIISIVSTVGIMISTAALIIVLSVFNGMEELVKNNFNSFNPDVKISMSHGKSFPLDSFPSDKILALKGVALFHEVVSDLVLINYQDKQVLVHLKGVGQNYLQDNQMKKLLIDGEFLLQDGHTYLAVPGSIVAGIIQLNLNSNELFHVYYPRRNKKNLIGTTDAFNKRYLAPAGVFASNTEYDEQYVFCDIEFARQLMEYNGEVTSIEVVLKEKADLPSVCREMAVILGENYQIQDKYQQEELLFKTMKSEKLVIFVILTFIMVVATFNIIGSLGMLIVEKKGDVKILHGLGSPRKLIRQIFILEGIFISFLGGVLGMLIGLIACFIQDTFHVITLGEGNYIITHYPVSVQAGDFAMVLAAILTISLLASWIPTRIIKKSMPV